MNSLRGGLRVAAALIMLLVALGPRPRLVAAGAPKCSLDLIADARRSGQLSAEDYLVQRVLAACRPQQLQARFQSAVKPAIRMCATDLFHEANAAFPRLSRKAQDTLYPIIRRRPVDNNGPIAYTPAALGTLSFFDSPGGNFRIHFVRTGSDAPSLVSTIIPGVPDWVVNVANAFDTSYAFETGTLGYRIPNNDFPAPAGFTDGGDGKIDVYLADIINSLQALGAELAERPSSVNAKTSVAFLVFDNDFVGTGFSGTPLQIMQVTAAHELHHAIQDAYDSDDQSGFNFWFYEATSSWMENQVFPSLPHFYTQRLPRWFQNHATLQLDYAPDLSINGDHGNASCIFNYYLQKKFGAEVVRQIWEALAADKSPDLDNLAAVDSVTRLLGSSRNAAFAEFLTFNYITGSRDDGQHYQHGVEFPLLSPAGSQTHSAYPARSPSSLPLPPTHLASNYIQFNHVGLKATEPTLVLNFDGQDSASWVAKLILVKDAPLSYTIRDLNLDALGRTAPTFTVNDFDQFDRALFVVGVASLTGSNFSYTYCAFLGNASQQQAASVTFNITPGASVWNMISNPLTLASADPRGLFGSTFSIATYAPGVPATGINQATNGYLFVTNPASAPDEPLRFARGRGFFLRTTGAGPFISSGTIADPCLPADIALNNNDWTLIGNPFATALAWNLDNLAFSVNGTPTGTLRSVLGSTTRAIEPYGWYWNPAANSGAGKYELVFDTTIIPSAHSSVLAGDGFFIKSGRSGVTLNLTSGTSGGAQRVLRPSVRASNLATSSGSWSVELKARAGSASDEGTLIGKTDSPLFSRGLQLDAPPAINATGVTVSLLPTEGRANRILKADVRGVGDRDVWNVLVTAVQPNIEVSLSWPNLSQLPRTQRLTLVDPATGQRLAMRTATAYTFRANSSGPTSRQLRIELTPATEGGIRFSSVHAQNLGSGVQLSYVLSKEAQVAVRVLSPAGKVIRTLPATAARAGLNSLVWDGKAQGALALPRGVYLLDLVARDDEGEETRALRSVVMK